MVSTDNKTKEVPWPFKVVSDDQSLKHVHFSSTSQDDQQVSSSSSSSSSIPL